MSASDIGSLVRDFGVPVSVLLFILFAGAKGWWVFGNTYDAMCRRADKYEDLALRALGAAEGGTEVAKKLAEERKQRAAEVAAAVAEALARREAP